MKYEIFIEAIICGVITLVYGQIIFNLTINKNNNNENNGRPFGINLAFFATGFFLNIIFDIIGFKDYLF